MRQIEGLIRRARPGLLEAAGIVPFCVATRLRRKAAKVVLGARANNSENHEKPRLSMRWKGS